MKLKALIAAFFLLACTLALPDDADAARMGGGRSFGSRPSMSRPAQQPMQRQQTPAAQAAPGVSKPGMFGGMGGLFGGLLAGTLLGSLLSGNGMGGGFMDLILIAILAFLAWKLFSRFRSQRHAAGYDNNAAGGYAQNQPFNQNQAFGQDQGQDQGQPMQRNAAESAWDRLNNAFKGAQQQMQPAQPLQPAQAATPDVPADFNVDEFLRGAKMAYTRMQKAWDERDLNDISQFATPTVMRELKEQAAEDPGPSHTEIMMVNAELVGVEPEGDNTRAQVYFDVLMRENPNQQSPENVREIWHFLRIGKNGNWKLDGIQQVE